MPRRALAKRIGAIGDDTLGYALQRPSPELVFALGYEIARRLKRNGIPRSDGSRGLVVAAVEGIGIRSSFGRLSPSLCAPAFRRTAKERSRAPWLCPKT